MTEQISSAATDLLNQHNITFDTVTIPLSEDKKPVRNLEALLEAEGRDPASVVRSLLFKTGSDTYVLLAVAGGGRADWGALRKHLGERKLKMADFDQVETVTGYVVGAVPPIALPESVTIVCDSSIEDYDTVIIGSGVLGYALALSSADLKAAMGDNVHTGSFIKAEA